MPEKEEILNFWFKECKPEQWFKKKEDFDQMIENRFSDAIEDAIAGKLDNWEDTETGCLALILLLDQFTRNVFRDTPRAFAGDKRALALSQLCCDKDYLANPDIHRRHFMLMPMMHSENLAVQDAALHLFKKYASEKDYEYAEKHREIIARFGRFPHRNVILGRKSTNEELEFLKQPGSSF
ncbi:uncharacterized protein METZ01_LOCUS92409 [marine metagenome]|uniref:DUF924 domain-containing protein n=1 Tax=marine metagenome TaxID=408172 RepID=A0A381VGT0_9ZZZZ